MSLLKIKESLMLIKIEIIIMRMINKEKKSRNSELNNYSCSNSYHKSIKKRKKQSRSRPTARKRMMQILFYLQH